MDFGFKGLADTSAVQTFIYQFVVLTKISTFLSRLTLKRFEEKYLLLSGFTLEVVQISPANRPILFSIHVSMKRCTVEHLTFTR